jgi:peptidyl-prolyl cis-trans isomerase D
MLESLRNFLTGPRLFIVIACCALPFVFLGTSSLSTAFGGSLGTINGEDVTETDFQIATNITIQKFKSVYGEEFDFNLLDEATQVDQIKQELTVQKVLLSKARNLGMVNSNSKKVAKKNIIKNPVFQIDGVFDESVFEAQVNSNGQTKDTYIDLMTELTAAELFRSALSSINFVTKEESLELAKLSEQSLDINFLKINFNSLKESISNNNDELNEYYANNQGLFYSDEERSFKYIVLTAKDYKDKVTVPEGFVENAYAEYLLKANERSQTRISHIMVNKSNHESSEDAFKAIEDIKSSLDTGADFSELASSFSDDIVSKDTGGDLEYFSSDIFPVEFGEAINGLEIGALSPIVELDDSFHIIKVTEINEVEVLSLTNLEKKIVSDLVTSESLALLNDDFIELDNMIASNSSIESIGEVLSEEILSSNSYSVNNFKFDINDRRISDYVFSSESEAGVTYAIELEDSFIVLSISDIKESSLMSLEDVSSEVSDYLSSMKAVEKKALIVSEIDSAKTDGTLESVIAGYEFIAKDNFVGVKRNSSLLPPEILSEVFKYSAGEQVYVDSNNGDMYLVDVLKLNLPSDEYISEVLEQYQNLAQERASQNMSVIMNEDLFDNARVNLNNLVF